MYTSLLQELSAKADASVSILQPCHPHAHSTRARPQAARAWAQVGAPDWMRPADTPASTGPSPSASRAPPICASAASSRAATPGCSSRAPPPAARPPPPAAPPPPPAAPPPPPAAPPPPRSPPAGLPAPPARPPRSAGVPAQDPNPDPGPGCAASSGRKPPRRPPCCGGRSPTGSCPSGLGPARAAAPLPPALPPGSTLVPPSGSMVTSQSMGSPRPAVAWALVLSSAAPCRHRAAYAEPVCGHRQCC